MLPYVRRAAHAGARERDADSITIVGASLAGIRGAETLRNDGYDGPITVIGDETETYDRPPLSKQLLAGKWDLDRVALYRPERLAELDLDLRLGVRATALDLTRPIPRARRRHERLPFDGLLIATGSSPRTLPNTPSLAGVYTLRTLDDSLAIRREFERNPRVVVVGAGFIGAEVAATARELGPRRHDDRGVAGARSAGCSATRSATYGRDRIAITTSICGSASVSTGSTGASGSSASDCPTDRSSTPTS